jgi:hypothetical protein
MDSAGCKFEELADGGGVSHDGEFCSARGQGGIMAFEGQAVAWLRQVAQDIAELRAASTLPEQALEVPGDYRVILLRGDLEDADW